MLVAAAARVMARDGIAQTTTRAITAEADMPRGSFHYCFRSKDELLRELITEVVTDMVAAARDAQTDTGDLSADLRAGLRGMFAAVTEHPDEQLVLYELTTYALRDPETVELARWQYENYLRQATDYLGFVADRARIRWALPIPVLARLLVTVIDGLALNWLPDRDTDTACQVLDAFGAHLATLAVPSA
ncbi:MAG TPA: TetR/AcrR family transcriptional regulator [Pseudonocardia sp.]|nr:TetR/AcrR family transcriptional regulator [Pseudonocardia sp.]